MRSWALLIDAAIKVIREHSYIRTKFIGHNVQHWASATYALYQPPAVCTLIARQLRDNALNPGH